MNIPFFLKNNAHELKNLNKIMADMEKMNSVLKDDIKKNKIDEFMKFDF